MNREFRSFGHSNQLLESTFYLKLNSSNPQKKNSVNCAGTRNLHFKAIY